MNLMGIVDNDGTRSNAGLALDATYPGMVSALGTELVALTYTDFFTYSIAKYRAGFVPAIFRLTAGFIDPDTLVLRESSDGSALVDSAGGEVVDPSYYRVDPTKGTFTLLRDVTEGYGTLTATYEAGFAESGGVAKGTPAWLQQAGVLAAAKLLQMNPSGFVARKALIMMDVQACFRGEISLIVNPHIRPRMGVTFADSFVSA